MEKCIRCGAKLKVPAEAVPDELPPGRHGLRGHF